MYRYQQLEAALDDAPEIRERPLMRSFSQLWPTLKRLLASVRRGVNRWGLRP